MSEEEITDKQRRVLDAAVEVFAEKGFAAASTSEIAKRAGVAEGTVFKTYKTKKALLLAAVTPVFTRFVAPHVLAEVVQIFKADHPHLEDALRALYTNRIRFVRSHERLVRVAIQELPLHTEVQDLMRTLISEQLWPHAVAMVERMQRAGEIRQAPPSSIIRIIAGTFLTYSVSTVMLGVPTPADDEIEIELMVRTVSQGLKP